MMQTTVTCDDCGADLTTTGNCEGFRLMLGPQRIPSRGGFVTVAAHYPAIIEPAHFCGLMCLGRWLNKTRPDVVARAAAAWGAP